MIKISTYYPYTNKIRFDFDYYTTSHIPLYQTKLNCSQIKITKKISDANPNNPPYYITTTNLYFDTINTVHKKFKTHNKKLFADIPNYTNNKPQFIITKILN